MRYVLAVLVAMVPSLAPTLSDAVRTFDDDREGHAPIGFAFSGNSPTVADRWLVRRERDNQVLVHLSAPARTRGIEVALLNTPAPPSVALSARFKRLGGQGPSGFVWRYQDLQNYYMVRFDAAEQEIDLYRVVRGNRIRIGLEEDLQVSSAEWHVLKATHTAGIIRIYLDGVKVFEVYDRTFRDGGAMGLWAAANAAVSIDDLRLEPGERDAAAAR